MVLDYPFIPAATRLERRHPALRGLDAVSFPFVNPIRAKPAPALAPPAPTPQTAPAKPTIDAAPTSGARIMDIKASQLCWVNAEVDGTIVLDMLLQPGESKNIHFDKALTVKFGNAGGVKVTLDNKPFPLNAQSGEVRTVTIP
jgi:cytoskeleton protein RodZ